MCIRDRYMGNLSHYITKRQRIQLTSHILPAQMSSKSNSKAPSQAAKPKSGIDEPKAPKKGEDDGNLKGRTSPQAGSDKGRKNSQADDINNDDVENERENDGGDLGDREEEEQGNDEDNENREEVDDREPGEEEEEEEGEREDHERDEGEIERDRNGGEREGDDEEELVTKEDPETEIHPLPEADGLPDDNEGKINFLLDRLELTEKALRELQQYLVEEKEINANLRMKILEQEDEIKKFKDDENNTLKEKIGTVLKSTFETSVLQKVEAEKREILALQNATEKNLMILELDSQVLQIRGEFFMQQKELEDAKHEISKLREQLENLEKENGELSTDRQQKHQRINELTEENSELFATLQKMKDVQNVLNRLLGDRKTKEELINAANYEGNEVRSAYSTERADQPVFLTEKEAPVQPTRLGQGNARNPPSRKGYSQDIGSNPCLLYTSPSPRDGLLSRMPSSA
eukprot:TRINITY_DN7689_c0_g1_i7.p1 TRINITY_DN7689_c0_g1~~TRINITY_DN7689_c0_g1_i7.p1  ORF type:complete len:462 (+),score=93.55 TRINITY_DN7689_c0_g1_i7:64-1449(+)